MKLIVAFCRNRGIGWKNSLPWHLKNDLQHFQKLTMGKGNNAVIMGRKTWERLPEKSKPLPKRTNIVLTRTNHIVLSLHTDKDLPHFCFRSLAGAAAFSKREYVDVWVIGGEQLYGVSLEKKLIQTIHATYIDKEFECDAFFPQIPNDFVLETQTQWEFTPEYRYRFQTFQSIHKFFRRRNFQMSTLN